MAPTTYTPPINTYVPLQTITLSSSASSVTFSNISQDYRDLVVVINFGLGGGGSNMFLTLNGDSNSGNYSLVTMSGNGSSTNSANRTDSASRIIGYNAYPDPANVYSTTYQVSFLDASATDKHKTILTRGNNANVGVSASATRWANTAAITSIGFSAETSAWIVGSTFSLYGIAG